MRRARTLMLLPWLGLSAGALTLPPDAAVQPIHPGARMLHIRREAGPWAIDGIVWDLHREDLRLRAFGGGGDRANAPEAVGAAVARLVGDEQRPVAACNADFFDIGNTGAPFGLFVVDGRLVSLPTSELAFTMLADGTPRILECYSKLTVRRQDGTELRVTRLNLGRGPDHLVLYTSAWGDHSRTNDAGCEVLLQVDGELTPRGSVRATVVGEPRRGAGDAHFGPGQMILSAHGNKVDAVASLKPGEAVTIAAELTPNLPVVQSVGGHPRLLAEGRPATRPGANDPRHPRTIIGFDDRQAAILVIDGRRPGHSIGMSIAELITLAREFGCTEALNLDGGGSSTCWVRGEIRNRPSDGRQRNVPNGLALLDLGRLGPPATITIEPPGPWSLVTGAAIEPTLRVADARLNPLDGAGTAVFSVDGPIGAVAGRRFVAGPPGIGRLVVRAGAIEQAVPITVVERPARLAADPSVLQLLPGEEIDVAVTGLDAAGRPVIVDGLPATWALDGALGTVTGNRLTAGGEGANGVATIRLAGAELRLPVAVARPVPFEDFETDQGWRFVGFPESVGGEVGAVPSGGGRAARLTYRLGTEPATRAAYVRLDRELPAPLGLRLRFRGGGQKAWLRVAVVDGNGTRDTYDVYQGALPGDWRTVTVPLPKGLKQPVTWQSVYAVATDASYAADGWVEWDDLAVMTVADP